MAEYGFAEGDDFVTVDKNVLRVGELQTGEIE
jgi:hypothetical protein